MIIIPKVILDHMFLSAGIELYNMSIRYLGFTHIKLHNMLMIYLDFIHNIIITHKLK